MRSAAACLACVMLALLSGCPTLPEAEGEAHSDGGTALAGANGLSGEDAQNAGGGGEGQPAQGGTGAMAGRGGAPPPDDGKAGESDPGAGGTAGGAAGTAAAHGDGGMDCGNGVLDEGEECDDMLDREPRTCVELELGTSAEPLVRCHACEWDARECTCGNGVLDEREECDGNLVEGTCQSVMGHAGQTWTGTLGCEVECHLNTSQCMLMLMPVGGMSGGAGAGAGGAS